jgi:YbgC/YbaW family acyl-CoA thioester hydrolase
MSAGFVYNRRIVFYETDLAGVVHFSNYFRYMEEAEHALWRAAGMRIDGVDLDVGWPRVSATFDYKRPLHYEDEIEIAVSISAVSRRTIQYAFRITRGETAIGVGSMTTACVTRDEGGMRSIDVPPEVASKLRAAAGQAAE